jgi:hypothetical protein
MSKLVSLLIIMDQFGHYPGGIVKQYPAKDLKVLPHYGAVATIDVPNPDCNDKFLQRAGEALNLKEALAGDGNHDLVIKLKYRDEWIYAQATVRQLNDLLQNCCVVGAPPTAVLSLGGGSPRANSEITFTAAVVGGDGAITKVEFFELETLFATDNSNAYTATRTWLTPGVRWLVAKVYDDAGRIGFSNWLKVVVGDAV